MFKKGRSFWLVWLSCYKVQDWTFYPLKSVKIKDFDINIDHCREEEVYNLFIEAVFHNYFLFILFS